mgnify:FL=1
MRIAELILYLLATLSLIYGAVVRATGSGTMFFVVWIAIAVVLVLFGISLHYRVWRKVPVWIRRVLTGIVALGFAAFLIVEGCVISHMNDQGEDRLDYIIVLGAQVYEDGPSPVLKYRLDRAIEYLEQNPDTYCILSGGQGANEPMAEAQGMADYMIRQGISEIQLVIEPESTTTEENIANSMKHMRKGASVGIVTNDFHMFRALQIAHKQGLTDACGIAADSMQLYLVNNMLREFFAEIKFLIS